MLSRPNSASPPWLDARRHAMLQAMGADPWWLGPATHAPATQRIPAHAAPHSPGGMPVAAEAATATANGTSAAEATRTTTAQRTPAAPARPARTHPAQAAAAPLAQPAATAHAGTPGTTVLTPAAPLFPPEAGQAAHASCNCLLVVDDLRPLGPEHDAALTLLHNMVRAMGLAHSPGLWCSWAQRPADGQPRQGQDWSLQAWLAQQRPALILALGRDSAQHLLGESLPLGALRKTQHQFGSTALVVSYSPAYLLRAAHAKRDAWRDLQGAMQLLRAQAPVP
ncbi:uracil-DNA glycosylase family protein [Vandammella animalimorsus]|nr:uracil-DNA glycosylase family protein [Vandammella animalimorsus]